MTHLSLLHHLKSEMGHKIRNGPFKVLSVQGLQPAFLLRSSTFYALCILTASRNATLSHLYVHIKHTTALVTHIHWLKKTGVMLFSDLHGLYIIQQEMIEEW